METVTDKLNCYRDIVENLLTEIAQLSQSDSSIQDKTLFDRMTDSYAIIEEGWENGSRVHEILIHLEISNGKIWIQADNTDLAIARELENAGIPKSDIVLGFHPPDVRPYTEYAPA